MAFNVFLRSAYRQPGRMLCLLAVTVLMTFAFAARGAEYLAIRQETDRLGSYYQSVGSLRPVSEGRSRDLLEAAARLEAEPLVDTVNHYNYVSGVIQDDFCNANTEFTMNYMGAHIVFYGRLTGWDKGHFQFLVDEAPAGLPEYVEEGRRVVLSRSMGHSWTTEMRNGLDADPAGAEAACEKLEIGGRYLAVGYYEQGRGSMCRLVITLEPDGMGGQREVTTTYALFSHALEDAFFYPVPEGGEADWSDPQLAVIRDHLELIREETKALNVIPLQDMSALPQVQDSETGIYLTEGRWLDRRDEEQKRRVCVVNAALAAMRGLELGDTTTIKLRDIPSYFGHCGEEWDVDQDRLETSTDTYEIVGVYDYLDTYEMTGIYNNVNSSDMRHTYTNTAVANFVYVPAFVLPEGFTLDRGDGAYEDALGGAWPYYGRWFQGAGSSLPLPGSISFRLTSPEVEAQFVKENQQAFNDMGFALEMEETGWESFQSTSAPMRESSLYNAAVYTAVLFAALGLAVFIYFFSRRKEMNIAHPLGLPRAAAARQIITPLLQAGAPGILMGSGAGWWYAGRSAEALLSRLPEVPGAEVEEVRLAPHWLAELCGIPLLLLIVLTLGGALFLVRQPLVKQQIGGKKATKYQTGTATHMTAPLRSVVTSAKAAAVSPPVPLPDSRTRTLGTAHVLRFVWRYILRSWGKSLLTVTLAGAFMVSLAIIEASIINNQQKVDDLYARTPVEVELLKADSTQSTTAGAFLFDDTLQTILDTGFISDYYIEGANYCTVFRYDEPWEPGQVLHIKTQELSKRTIRSIDNAEKFLSGGSGSSVTVTYADGWDETLFSRAWDVSTGETVPIVLPRETWDAFEIRPGDLMAVSCKGSFNMCAVAGYYEGEVAGEYKAITYGEQSYNDNVPILMPTSGLRSMVRSMLYNKAVFRVDPEQNQNLDAFRAEIEALASRPRIGGVRVRTILRDEELRTVVEPIEASIRLMQVLYPVTLILSLLSAGGLSALLTVLSSKEAAMMRIQGTTKARTILMLSLQQAFPCCAGSMGGLAGILLYICRTRPELLAGIAPGAVLCAVLYLIAGIAGAAACSAAVIGKNPLEMLQVKE